jgi:SAM-dependent methyltransferase
VPDRETLRTTFDYDAALYARSRPPYPAELFDDLAELVPGRRALEIGCGTGQATLPLAHRGFEVTAIELGTNMAEAARRVVTGLPVQVVNAAFEQWPLPEEKFDLVLAATAWHWVDPGVRVAKAAEALRPGGTVAIISTEHVKGGTLEFFAAMQPIYEHFDPSTPPGLTLRESDDIPYDSTEFAGVFGPVTVRRYHLDVEYSTREYLDLLSTYSGHIALPDDARRGLFGGLADLIDNRHGGRITKRYMFQTLLASATR